MPNWSEIVTEVTKYSARARIQSENAFGIVRQKYLKQLHETTGRNIIAYYSGWLSKGDGVWMTLTDEDKNGFMTCVHGLDRSKGLDLILHTPGGSISATQSLVHYLQDIFGNDIRAIVPQIAMSAGTMLACSCKSIVMGRQSNLGPIDPQLNGIPAYAALEEFERAVKEVIGSDGKPDKARLLLWQQIISRYQPTFLTQCEHAIERSNRFVADRLASVMFKDEPEAKAKAKKVVEELTKHQQGHDKHYHLEECKQIGLNIYEMEKDQGFQDGVLSVHHSFMHTLMNTPTIKIVENHIGVGLIKNVAA